MTTPAKRSEGEAPATPDRIGQVLMGKLRVLRHVGGGGMGDVYEVEHLLTHHRRALKIVRPELARQPRYVERLLREAGIAGKLKTQFVAETLDAGRLEDGSAYVLMELLTGRSLHEVLELDPRLAQRRVANIISQVAEGMGVAHAAGIVHRDLKPENIFLVGDEGTDRVKILDFGISKITDALRENATRLTREGTVIGTPFYMSPEQAAGRDVDARTDIWAMGVIAYEALTGKVPFNGNTVGEVMMMIASGNYPPVTSRRPDVDGGFAAVIDRALRPDPRDRYESAEAMRRDLLLFATNEPAARAKTISDGARAELTSDRPLPLPPLMPREERPTGSNPPMPAPATRASSEVAASARRAQGILLGLAIVLALGLTIFISTSHRTGEAPGITTPVASSVPSHETVPIAPPSTASTRAPEIQDAGSIATTLAPPTTRIASPPATGGDARPRVLRTRAEIVGLDENPYGTH